MDKVSEGKIEIRVTSFLLIFVSIMFLLFDVILTKGFFATGHEIGENAQTLILVLAYALFILSIVAAVFGLINKFPKITLVLGLILLVLGTFASVYYHLKTGNLNQIAIFVGVLGAIYSGGSAKILNIIK